MLTNTSRLAEWGGSLVGLVATRSVVGVALGSLAGRALAIGWMARLAMREGGPYRFGFADAHWAEIRALLKPALSFMVFPLANALTFQGITLTVGHFYGARVVAIFNAHRTLSRLLVQAISVLGLSVWTEFARLFGQDDRAGLRRLFRNASGLAILGSAVMGAALFVTAPFIIRWWSRGAISFNSSLLALLLVSAVLNGFWFVPRVLLMSINAHVKLSQWTLATSALTLGLAFAFGRHFGVLSSASAMIVGDAAICLVGTVFAVRLTDAKLGRSPREDTPLTPTADRAA
jgi:O-antigen/teichoic acid export membrane protein